MGTERVRKGCWYGEGMGGLLGGGGPSQWVVWWERVRGERGG